MARSRKVGSLKGLGAKYGGTVRERYSRIVGILRMRRRCPRCGAWRIKRQAPGIWRCRSCSFTVAGGAFDATIHTS